MPPAPHLQKQAGGHGRAVLGNSEILSDQKPMKACNAALLHALRGSHFHDLRLQERIHSPFCLSQVPHCDRAIGAARGREGGRWLAAPRGDADPACGRVRLHSEVARDDLSGGIPEVVHPRPFS